MKKEDYFIEYEHFVRDLSAKAGISINEAQSTARQIFIQEETELNLVDFEKRIAKTNLLLRVANSVYEIANGHAMRFEDLRLKDGATKEVSPELKAFLSDPVHTVQQDSAEHILLQCQLIQKERGAEYNKDGGPERNMSKICQAFNIICGQDLTETQGWLFMQVLKDVRFFQNPDKPHRDSLIDGVSYGALKAESVLMKRSAS